MAVVVDSRRCSTWIELTPDSCSAKGTITGGSPAFSIIRNAWFCIAIRPASGCLPIQPFHSPFHHLCAVMCAVGVITTVHQVDIGEPLGLEPPPELLGEDVMHVRRGGGHRPVERIRLPRRVDVVRKVRRRFDDWCGGRRRVLHRGAMPGSCTGSGGAAGGSWIGSWGVDSPGASAVPGYNSTPTA